MSGETLVGVFIALISASGLFAVAKVNTSGSNQSSTVKSALELQARYEEINTTLTQDIKDLNTSFNLKIKSLEAEIDDMKKQFQEKETYYVIELEKKDEIIEELEIVIVEKDMIIDELKGGV